MTNRMMRYLLSFLLIFSASLLSAFAQSGWTWINPALPPSYLNTVRFTDAYNGTAVGEGGVIVNTTDGGAHWTAQGSGTPNPLYALSFGDHWHGIAGGSFGVIVRTTDAGRTWTRLAGINENWFLKGASFVNASVGTMVGYNGSFHLILRTTDGGTTWTQQTTPVPWANSGHYTLTAVSFLDVNVGVAVSDGGDIIRTTDGGAHWTQQASPLKHSLAAICFTSASNGIVVGSGGAILHTTDGGITWNVEVSGTLADFSGVSFLDSLNGTAVGVNNQLGFQTYGGVAYHTTDGGVTWKLLLSTGNAYQCDVALTSTTNATIVGSGNGWYGGSLFQTTDVGVTWANYFRDLGFARQNAVAMIGPNTWFTVSDNGTIARTTDSGAHWTTWNLSSSEPLLGIHFSDATHGTAVGGYSWFSGVYGWQTLVFIVHTTDGGSSWTYQTSPSKNIFKGIFCVDANIATAVGDNGAIIRTTDGGTTWVLQQSPVAATFLQDVVFTDANTGTAVGTNGVIIHTTDGGTTWTLQPSGTVYHLYGVSFANAMIGTVVGYLGTILHTTDGGATWQPQASPVVNDLYDVAFSDVNTGTAVGMYGSVIRTTDGGQSWSSQPTGGSIGLLGVAFSDANTGTIVGSAGAILHTVTGGVATALAPAKGPIVPAGFSLEQNYPNPFNPVTTIKYTLGGNGAWGVGNGGEAGTGGRGLGTRKTMLVIYDVLGRQVATLVDEVKAPGSYEVRFDASGLASGVYFYRLTAGSFVETKQMTLLR